MIHSLLKGFHKHHIIPKHVGGTDEPNNLVLLHPIDHAIFHLLRFRQTNHPGDAWAFNRLMAQTGEDGFGVTGYKRSEETRKKMSESVRQMHKENPERAKRFIEMNKQRRGDKHPNWGKPPTNKGKPNPAVSKSNKQRRGEKCATSKPCIVEGVRFNNTREAAEYFNVPWSTLRTWFQKKVKNPKLQCEYI